MAKKPYSFSISIGLELEPNPQSSKGKIYGAIIESRERFEAVRMHHTSTKTLSVNTNRHKFAYKRTYETF